MKLIEKYFQDLDREWTPLSQNKLTLKIIGSGALFLQTNYERGTKDSDVLETSEISNEVYQRLQHIGGKDSQLFRKHRVHLDIVKEAIPFLPQKPIFHDVSTLKLKNLSIQVLDIVDVVVSKLKPFRPRDVEDIEFLVTHKHLSHKKLVERFNLVIDYHSTDARAEDFPKLVRNLHQIERMMIVPESKIDLPDWL